MKILFELGLAMVVALVAYLMLWPVPVEPVSWDAPKFNGYQGVHSVNDLLAGLHTIELDGEAGPEHIAVGPDEKLYVGVLSGHIIRMNPDGSDIEIFVDTGGRVLGFDFDARGNLIAADSMKGLISVSPAAELTLLTREVRPGDPIVFANSVQVADNGLIYFTESSTRFSPVQWGGTMAACIMDLLEQSGTGRLLVYDPATGVTDIVVKGLSFANGVAQTEDGSAMLVVETGKYRVWKVDAQARQVIVDESSPHTRVLLDNLPGFPDNLTRGLNGRIWLGLTRPRNPLVDQIADKPFLRKMTYRLPQALWPVPEVYSHVIAFNEKGVVVVDMQDPDGRYPETSGATETKDKLFIQSLDADSIGWMKLGLSQ